MKRALVIGASRGIGRASALRLARDGFDIIASCRSDVKKLETLRDEIKEFGRNCDCLAFDIAGRQEASEALEPYTGELTPDIILYNAGVARDNLMVFMSPAEWDEVIHTNLDGFFNVVNPLLFDMLARKQGRIIVMTSASGQAGQPGQVNYSASKAGLIGAVKALAKEVGKKGILVNAVSPGFIATDMTSEIPEEHVIPQIPLKRVGTPEDIAGVVSFLCGPDSSYIHGQVIAVNGGMVI
ncbi:MAG: 3-oxoacyl-ACP reductase FabG [Victivallales bacterium]